METSTNTETTPTTTATRRILRAVGPRTGPSPDQPHPSQVSRRANGDENVDEDEENYSDAEEDEDEEEEDEDEDDDFDDDYNDNGEHDEDVYPDFLRYLARAHGGCDCPECTRRAMAELLGQEPFDSDYDDENEDDDNDEGEGEGDDASHDEKESVQDGAPTCAVCLEPQTTRRKLAHLPCCSTSSAHDHSSTRFCESCLRQCLRRYGTRCTTGLVGECPRCKHVLYLPSGDDTHLQPAPTLLLLKYIASKNEYLHLVSVIASSDSSYIPLQAFPPDSPVDHLVQWGLIQKRPGDLFVVDPEAHKKLREWTEQVR